MSLDFTRTIWTVYNPASSASRSSDSAQLLQLVTYYHDPTHLLPYYRSPAGQYIRDVFRRENCCFDCRKTGHQHAQCPSHTHHTPPKLNQLETELTAGDATSAYLALAQTIPSAAEPIQDSSYALFYPLLAISAPNRHRGIHNLCGSNAGSEAGMVSEDRGRTDES
ncbi:hypothetical protein C368_04677 [Cryptococcus neoformans 125.91]|nr:hypothetical protein C368_04677 [Cryptococcus neoformans var. grubii 125.91]